MKYLGCSSTSCLLDEAILVDNPNFVITTNFGGNIRELYDINHGNINGNLFVETISTFQFSTELFSGIFLFIILYAVLFIKR